MVSGMHWVSAAFAAAVLVAPSLALADRIALLPSRGGNDAGPRVTLDAELARELGALGHTLVPAPELGASLATQVPDGLADTQDEYRAVSSATQADWVVVGMVEPAVTTVHVELVAFLHGVSRVESVAREVDRAREASQVREMLSVLVRPEGVGAAALPWEKAGADTPPGATGLATRPAVVSIAVPPVDGHARVSYLLGSAGEVWPPYSSGNRGFVGTALGFGLTAASPPSSSRTSSGAALVGTVRSGYALGDRGFEPFAELGANLFGPRALWLSGGARWMFAPALRRGSDGVLAGVPFFLGPEVSLGAFIQLGGATATTVDGRVYSASASAEPTLGASVDLAYALSPTLQIDATLGNLRWVPGNGGSVLLVGGTVGASLRF